MGGWVGGCMGEVTHTERKRKDLAIKLILESSFTILVVKGLVVLAERGREREGDGGREKENVCFVCFRVCVRVRAKLEPLTPKP